jgi:hypothetical protein
MREIIAANRQFGNGWLYVESIMCTPIKLLVAFMMLFPDNKPENFFYFVVKL